MPGPGEVYWTVGEARPCIVVSRTELNRGDYLLVVPVTSQRLEVRWELPNCVPFRSGECGFTKDCVAQAEAMTLIEKQELDLDPGPSARLGDERFRDLVKAIGYVIQSECEPM